MDRFVFQTKLSSMMRLLLAVLLVFLLHCFPLSNPRTHPHHYYVYQIIVPSSIDATNFESFLHANIKNFALKLFHLTAASLSSESISSLLKDLHCRSYLKQLALHIKV